MSSKCLQEINCLRQVYHPDLPQCTDPRQCTTQTRKHKLARSLSTTTTETPSSKRSKRNAVKRKAPVGAPSQTPMVEGTPPVPRRKRVSPPLPPQPTTHLGDGKCNEKFVGGPQGKTPLPWSALTHTLPHSTPNRTEINHWHLMGNYFDTYSDKDDYLQTTGMAEDGV